MDMVEGPVQAPENPGVTDHNSPHEKLWLKLQSGSMISSHPCDFHPPGHWVLAPASPSCFSAPLGAVMCWFKLILPCPVLRPCAGCTPAHTHHGEVLAGAPWLLWPLPALLTAEGIICGSQGRKAWEHGGTHASLQPPSIAQPHSQGKEKVA